MSETHKITKHLPCFHPSDNRSNAKQNPDVFSETFKKMFSEKVFFSEKSNCKQKNGVHSDMALFQLMT